MTNAKEINQAVTKEQQARAKLRQLFIKGIEELNGKASTIMTYEKTTLNATFAAWHPNGFRIICRDLETPAYLNISTAQLRTPDVLALEFDQPVTWPCFV